MSDGTRRTLTEGTPMASSAAHVMHRDLRRLAPRAVGGQGVCVIASGGCEAVAGALKRARRVHAKVKQHAMAAGLTVYPMGGTVDGLPGDHVLLAPPFIASESELDAIVARPGSSIDAAIAA